jgi:hypothetical protein
MKKDYFENELIRNLIWECGRHKISFNLEREWYHEAMKKYNEYVASADYDMATFYNSEARRHRCMMAEYKRSKEKLTAIVKIAVTK